MAKHTLDELQQWQALPLGIKIRMTEERIRDWVREYGEDGVYVSFSGGKDSTVLLDIVRKLYPNVKAVFVDTGLEYPEIREFVRGFDNVDWLKPKMNFKQVIEKYGYPFIGKKQAGYIGLARKNIEQGKYTLRVRSMGITVEEAKDMGLKLPSEEMLARYERTTNGSIYNIPKYRELLNADFRIHSYCCDEMKKKPIFAYQKRTGRKPFIGTMAYESRNRRNAWLQNGCNAFNAKKPSSQPISFWTEQDILHYIKKYNIPYASVYGDIVIDEKVDGDSVLEGQMNMIDYLGCHEPEDKLKTTGCDRTGCMFCGFGCHLEKSPNRFERMKETHPKQYDYIMRPKEQGGLNYKEVIDWINEHGNMNIKY